MDSREAGELLVRKLTRNPPHGARVAARIVRSTPWWADRPGGPGLRGGAPRARGGLREGGGPDGRGRLHRLRAALLGLPEGRALPADRASRTRTAARTPRTRASTSATGRSACGPPSTSTTSSRALPDACRDGGPPGAAASVVFVCEHGNVKSLIAMRVVQPAGRRARHLAVRAVSRGADARRTRCRRPSRAPAARTTVSTSRPSSRAPSRRPTSTAPRLVMIGAEPRPGRASGAPSRWDGIPPASKLRAARDALRERIAALLSALAPAPPER